MGRKMGGGAAMPPLVEKNRSTKIKAKIENHENEVIYPMY